MHYHRDTRTLRIPDGTVAVYGEDGLLQSIGDPFGNLTTLAREPGLLTVEQSLGNGDTRTVVLQMDARPGR